MICPLHGLWSTVWSISTTTTAPPNVPLDERFWCPAGHIVARRAA